MNERISKRNTMVRVSNHEIASESLLNPCVALVLHVQECNLTSISYMYLVADQCALTNDHFYY